MKKVIAISLLALAVSACDRKQPEGPAERAGRRIDNAADSVHDGTARTVDNARSMGRELRSDVTPSDETVERTKENAREIGRDVRARINGTDDVNR